MSALGKGAALVAIELIQSTDMKAADEAIRLAGGDAGTRTFVERSSELRQSLLMIVKSAIDAGLDPALAIDRTVSTAMMLAGTATRLAHGGESVCSECSRNIIQGAVAAYGAGAGVEVKVGTRSGLDVPVGTVRH